MFDPWIGYEPSLLKQSSVIMTLRRRLFVYALPPAGHNDRSRLSLFTDGGAGGPPGLTAQVAIT